MTKHLGNEIPSPAIREKIGTAFRRGVRSFAEDNDVPIVKFGKGDRKQDVMRPHLARQAKSGARASRRWRWLRSIRTSSRPTSVRTAATPADRCGSPSPRPTDGSPASTPTSGTRTSDPRSSRCAPTSPTRSRWLNGHEWAKRQATRSGIGFTALSNGFATRTDPAGLQAICDRLGPGTITVFFERWMSRLPLPLSEADHDAGYWWELSMRQIETSRTIVFDAPRHARAFFEALVVDNLDIGRPDRVEVIFAGHPAGGDVHPRSSRPTRPASLPVTPSG
ncbi:hypothetical protein ACI3ET_15965 [Ornithinimicrobium sp. LYQ121]|uniref:hypothetical protein n=1 Tax=Ornithinimicrobium sp. LYQ121 TaxID=3378801 RepID=UPI003853CD2D